MNAYAEIRQHIAVCAQRLTPDRELADEITQQVLIKVHESLAQLREPHKLQAWLRKIVYNTLMDHHRQRQALPLPDGLELAEGETLDEAGNQAVIGCLESLIKALSPAYRQVLAAVERQPVADRVRQNPSSFLEYRAFPAGAGPPAA